MMNKRSLVSAFLRLKAEDGLKLRLPTREKRQWSISQRLGNY
jgi:hypothetical protein